MDGNDWLAQRFEADRGRLRAVAYRILGSLAEADDAVQDAWVRVSRAGADDIENIGGWLTTVVARVSLNMLRARGVRREEPWEGGLPDPVVTPDGPGQPEEEAVLADSLGLALQIVLDTLAPAERLAFVLHDMFDLPFDEIAPMVGRSADATRQLASRARRRVRGAEPAGGAPDPGRRRAVVDAFFTAARAGDLEALVAVLHPDVVLRVDAGPVRPAASRVVRGALAVARQARLGATAPSELHQALVNGAAGAVITRGGTPWAVMGFTVVEDRIVEIDVIADPERVGHLVTAVLGPSPPR